MTFHPNLLITFCFPFFLSQCLLPTTFHILNYFHNIFFLNIFKFCFISFVIFPEIFLSNSCHKYLFPKVFCLGILSSLFFSQSFAFNLFLEFLLSYKFWFQFFLSKMCSWNFCFLTFTPISFFYFLIFGIFLDKKNIDSNFWFLPFFVIQICL